MSKTITLSPKTTTLSVRVPLDVAEMVANRCLERGINRNKLLTEYIASEGVYGVNSFNQGGEIAPSLLTDVLVGVGAVASGTCIYHLLKNNLPETWTDDQREIASIVSGIATGLAMVYGLGKATRKG
jgi:hypothetical protein